MSAAPYRSRHAEDQDSVPADVFAGCTQQGADMIAHFLMRGTVLPPEQDRIAFAAMIGRLKAYLPRRSNGGAS